MMRWVSACTLGRDSESRAFGLDFLLELLVLHPVVAFEGKPVDHRRFHHRDDDVAARLGDVDVVKKAGGIERFQPGVDLGGVEVLAGADLEIAAHRIRFDAAVALDHDAVDGRASLSRRRGMLRRPAGQQNPLRGASRPERAPVSPAHPCSCATRLLPLVAAPSGGLLASISLSSCRLRY